MPLSEYLLPPSGAMHLQEPHVSPVQPHPGNSGIHMRTRSRYVHMKLSPIRRNYRIEQGHKDQPSPIFDCVSRNVHTNQPHDLSWPLSPGELRHRRMPAARCTPYGHYLSHQKNPLVHRAFATCVQGVPPHQFHRNGIDSPSYLSQSSRPELYLRHAVLPDLCHSHPKASNYTYP